MIEDKKRIHCSDEDFLTAVYSSKTYAEIAAKTGQKLTSTMTRYSKTKKMLAAKGVSLPEMQRKKPTRLASSVEHMIEIIDRLKKHHSES